MSYLSRLILLPGYTEDQTIFTTLLPLLPTFGQVLALELEEEFAHWHPAGRPTVVALAQYLVARHRIGPSDVLIGHSMGGWIAAHLKEQTGATAILLSSFTNQAKIVSGIRHPRLLGLAALTGLVQNRAINTYFKRRYRYDESRALHAQFVDGAGAAAHRAARAAPAFAHRYRGAPARRAVRGATRRPLRPLFLPAAGGGSHSKQPGSLTENRAKRHAPHKQGVLPRSGPPPKGRPPGWPFRSFLRKSAL